MVKHQLPPETKVQTGDRVLIQRKKSLCLLLKVKSRVKITNKQGCTLLNKSRANVTTKRCCFGQNSALIRRGGGIFMFCPTIFFLK